MKNWLDPVRWSVEKVPVAAESYRLLRDYLKFRRSEPRDTPLGFRLMGNAKMQAGQYEPVETRVIGEALDRADVFVDVGANIGYYSCLAAARGRRVIAVEPAATVLRFLYANLLANGHRDVEVFPVGLSDHVELAVLYGGGGTASLIPGWSRASHVYSSVIPTTTLDHLLGSRYLDKRLFIKIDIEGMEYACLQGATETLARVLAPTWFVEIYLNEGHPQGLNPHFLATFELFWRHGYQAREAVPDGKAIARADVERWVAEGRVGSPTPNYWFAKPAR